MPGPEPKSVLLPQSASEVVEGTERDLDHHTAFLTDQVLMRFAQVIHGRAVAKVRVLDESKFLEQAQGPIDRRRVDVRTAGLNLACDLLGTSVVVRFEKRAQHGPASRGDAVPEAAKFSNEIFVGHTFRRRGSLDADSLTATHDFEGNDPSTLALRVALSCRCS